MSGGQLVVLDRLGRDVKRFPLAAGLVTLGSDHSCDIRFMLDTVNPHHATVAVHANQTVVRNISAGETLVNGLSVSVAALRHGDVLSIGGRQLRWDYADAAARRPMAAQPALYVARRAGRAPRRASGPPNSARRDPQLQLKIEMAHRASMPANAGGKQVAIVQPQRRDTNDQNEKPPKTPIQSTKRSRASRGELDTSASDAETEKVPRKSSLRPSPGALHGTTKATLWIESRKSSPRNGAASPKTGAVSPRSGAASPRSGAASPRSGAASPRSGAASPRTGAGSPRTGAGSPRTGAGSPRAGPAVRRAASARKSTPLRLTVLKRAQSAQKMKVTKIEEPLKIDHTKQAAILLMTGHTPKSRLLGQKTPSPKSESPKTVSPKSVGAKSVGSKSVGRRSASFVVKKKSPVVRRSTARGRSSRVSGVAPLAASPDDRTVTILEITDSVGRNSTLRQSSRRSQRSLEQSPLLPSPKKSALKNPLAKKSMRKTESIKFDLSNLENRSQESDAMIVAESPQDTVSLRYSSSSVLSPSPRRSIHSRSSRMLQQTLGSSVLLSPSAKSVTLTLTPSSPSSPRRPTSARGSVIMQRALNKSDSSVPRDSSVQSAFRTRTLSPRDSQNDLESYSIVDLVSIDSNESGRSTSVYNSAGSSSSVAFGTPRDSAGRKTRSTIDATLLGSSTPYVKATKPSTPRSRSSPSVSSRTSNDSTRLAADLTARSTRASKNTSRLSSNSSRLSGNSSRSINNSSRLSNNSTRVSNNSTRLSNNSTRLSNKSSRSINKSSASTRKTKSLSTPENASIPISVNSTRVSRASHSRSRINDSDLLLIEPEDAEDSPRSSKRASKDSKRSSSAPQRGSKRSISSPVGTPPQEKGISTPENNQSPEEASTPVLSIQSLLDSSQNSIQSQTKKRGRPSLKRKTIGVISGHKARVSTKSKSMNVSARRSRLRMSNDSYENINVSEQNVDSENVTPKSAVKLVHEAVKNKHSTAKKTQSKRSMIDDLNDSDIVKQLFNSPVKRKLSQSMTEFSRKHLFDDDDVVQLRRPTRNTVALTGRTPDNSLLDNSEAFSPEQFVSPISTPGHSPNLTGIKRLFRKKTPENDLRNVRGVKALLRTPRARRSIRNDLTDVVGVKAVFAKSPRNRLSDVRVKEVFAPSPRNDLRRVSGVKTLFRSQKERKSPRNSLSDVRGVKKMFNRKSAANDLRKVSGVKKALQINSPNNDLRDVRGVKRLFRQDKGRNDLSDMSGVEELFNESNTSHRDADSLFDQLIGKPTIKAVYSRTLNSKKTQKKKSSPKSRSLVSLDVITDNPEEWLEQKLQEIRSKRLQKEAQSLSSSKSANKSKSTVARQLLKLVTDTVEGSSPLRTSRVRHSTVVSTSIIEVPRRQKSASELYSAHMLPIKKRSLVDASLELPKVDKVVNLPIKKRVVVHSTPMKGRQVNITMNASELGRVSPIVAEKTRDLEHDLPSSNINKEAVESKPQGRRGTRAQPAVSPKLKKPTPKKSRGQSRVPTPVKTKPSTPNKDKTPAKTKTPSPAKKPASPKSKTASAKKTRSRRTATASPKAEANTKKRGATLVVAKKTPVMSPKVSRTRKVPGSVPTTQASPKASRTRKETESVPTPKANPKASRKRKETETAPSPKASPKASRKRKETETATSPKASPKASRKRKETESAPSPKASPKASRKRKETETATTPKASPKASRKRKETETAPNPKASPKASRKRKEPESVLTPKASPKTSRKRKEPESAQTPKASPKRTRGARNKDDNVVEKPKTPKNTRAKVLKATVVVSKPSPQLKPRAARGRPPLNTSKVQKQTPKLKAKAKKESPKKSPAQQKPAKNVSVENVPKSRRRNNTATNDESKQNDVEKPQPKPKRGRNVNVEVPPVARNTRKTDKQDVPVEEPKKPRGKKAEKQESTQSEPTTRSRRGTKPNTTAPEVNTRKRKTTAPDDRPTKVSKNKEVETKGNSKKIESPMIETPKVPKKGNKKQAGSAATKKPARGNKTDVSAELSKLTAQKPTRGKKSAVVESAPDAGKRKRKTAVEATPVEDKKVRSTRSRADPAPAAVKPGRPRRR